MLIEVVVAALNYVIPLTIMFVFMVIDGSWIPGPILALVVRFVAVVGNNFRYSHTCPFRLSTIQRAMSSAYSSSSKTQAIARYTSDSLFCLSTYCSVLDQQVKETHRKRQ